MNSNTYKIRKLLGIVKRILVVTESGRCYCCGKQAHDVAHIFGVSNLATAFDTHREGNCHLLCRECHSEDHKGNLDPSYKDVFIGRNGKSAYFSLSSRSKTMVISAKDFLEATERSLDEELEDLYR